MWILTKFVNNKSITLDSHLGKLAQMAVFMLLFLFTLKTATMPSSDKVQGIYELALPLPKSYGVFLVTDSVK